MQRVEEKLKSNWKFANLGEIANITNGKSNTQDAVSDGEYLFFDRSALVKKSSKFLFDTEAIILPGEGAEFIPKYFKGKFDLHQRAYSIVPNEKVDGVYLYYFLFAKRNLFVKKSVGSTVRSLRLPIIQSISVLLPPLAEQKKIAEILSKVDEDIKKTDEVIKKTNELKRGLMQELFTKGIGHNKFKKTKLGMIPEEWEIVKIEEVASVKAGTGFPIKHQGDKKNELPFYKVSDMNTKGNEKYMKKSNNYISSNLAKELRGSVFSAGCIIYPKVGAALLGNKRRILSQESLVDNNIGVLIPNKKVESNLLYFQLLLIDMAKFSGNGALPAVNASVINNIEIVLPKLIEQKKIENILSKVDGKIDIYKKIKSKLETLKKGLMQDLLMYK